MISAPFSPRSSGRRAAPRAPRTITVRGILASTLAIGVGVTLAVGAAGGSYALWNDQQALSNAGTITSGSIGLTVNGGTAVTVTDATLGNMLPGESVRLPLTLANTGSVDVTLSALGSGSLMLALRAGACTSTAGTSLASAIPFGELAAGASSVACLTVTLPATATRGATAPFGVTFTATQKARL